MSDNNSETSTTTNDLWRARPKTTHELRTQFGTWKAILGYADWQLDDFRRDILSDKIDWEFDEEFLNYVREMA